MLDMVNLLIFIVSVQEFSSSVSSVSYCVPRSCNSLYLYFMLNHTHSDALTCTYVYTCLYMCTHMHSLVHMHMYYESYICIWTLAENIPFVFCHFLLMVEFIYQL